MNRIELTALLVATGFILAIGVVIWVIYRNGNASPLEPPIIFFRTKFWNLETGYLLFISCVPLYGLLTMCWILATGGKLAALVMVVVMVCFCTPFACYLWLNWTFWQHDQYNELTFYRTENRFVYQSNGYDYSYNVSDVVQLTHYSVKNYKLPFSYTILIFRDGQELLVTYLLCDSLNSLLPASKRETIKRWFPRLPEFTAQV